MRVAFKIILFPLSLVLTIFVAISTFMIERLAGLLNIVSGIIFLGSLLAFLQYFFGWPYGKSGESSSLQLAIIATVMAFILSPYGLPTLTLWIVTRLDDLNDAIKSI